MTCLIDNSLDELEIELRDLKREVSRLEGFIRQLGSTDDGAVSEEHANSSSFSSPSATRRAGRDGRGSLHRRQGARSLVRRRRVETSR
jgi:hypothetical protein